MRSTALLVLLAASPALLLYRPAVEGEAPARKPDATDVVLVIHGGAGPLTSKEMKAEDLDRGRFEKGLAAALRDGYRAMQGKGKTSVDGVEAAIRSMEDNPLFNAGKGAVLTSDGQAELDASIMEGNVKDDGKPGKMNSRKRAGAVAGVKHIKNPISAARAVMEDQRHVLLVGEGAESFALDPARREQYRIEEVNNTYFWTPRQLKALRKKIEAQKKKPAGQKSSRLRAGPYHQSGTVGAVALCNDTLAAGTSTGGLTYKLRGRVGDSPLIGAGTYADDRACGVSCTGTGEVFIRHGVAHDVIARRLYKKQTTAQAAWDVINELPDEEGGVGGLIALDRQGNAVFAMSGKDNGLYRGYVTRDGKVFVAIYKKDRFKPMGTTGK
jgi:beta-aspartyl-peptidase (threonine type)